MRTKKPTNPPGMKSFTVSLPEHEYEAVEFLIRKHFRCVNYGSGAHGWQPIDIAVRALMLIREEFEILHAKEEAMRRKESGKIVQFVSA